jgi:hypothetical protein
LAVLWDLLTEGRKRRKDKEDKKTFFHQKRVE